MGNLCRSATEMNALIQPPKAVFNNEKNNCTLRSPSKYPITGSQSLLTAGYGLADSERVHEAVF